VRRGFFGWFNRVFERGRDRYAAACGGVIARSYGLSPIYAAIVAAVGLLFVRLPTSFVPNEDQGYSSSQVQTPPGATQHATGRSCSMTSAVPAQAGNRSRRWRLHHQRQQLRRSRQSQGMVYAHLKRLGKALEDRRCRQ